MGTSSDEQKQKEMDIIHEDLAEEFSFVEAVEIGPFDHVDDADDTSDNFSQPSTSKIVVLENKLVKTSSGQKQVKKINAKFQ